MPRRLALLEDHAGAVSGEDSGRVSGGVCSRSDAGAVGREDSRLAAALLEDHAGGDQRLDLGLGEAELGQDLAAVLAEAGRGAGDRARACATSLIGRPQPW